MQVSWKSVGNRVRIGNWPPMAWAALGLILVSITVTAIVGVQLYAATEHPAEFSNK